MNGNSSSKGWFKLKQKKKKDMEMIQYNMNKNNHTDSEIIYDIVDNSDEFLNNSLPLPPSDSFLNLSNDELYQNLRKSQNDLMDPRNLNNGIYDEIKTLSMENLVSSKDKNISTANLEDEDDIRESNKNNDMISKYHSYFNHILFIEFLYLTVIIFSFIITGIFYKFLFLLYVLIYLGVLSCIIKLKIDNDYIGALKVNSWILIVIFITSNIQLFCHNKFRDIDIAILGQAKPSY